MSPNTSHNCFTINSPHTQILQGTSCAQAVSHTLKRKCVFPPQGCKLQQVTRGQRHTFHPTDKMLFSVKAACGTLSTTPIGFKSSQEGTDPSHSKDRLMCAGVEDEHQRAPHKQTANATVTNEAEARRTLETGLCSQEASDTDGAQQDFPRIHEVLLLCFCLNSVIGGVCASNLLTAAPTE